MPTKNKSRESSCDVPEKTERAKDEERFVRDALIRGEAAHPSEDGELPPGATHKIVENENEEELPQLERERFSIY